MSRRTTGLGARAWLWAAAGSLSAHVLVLLVLALARRTGGEKAVAPGVDVGAASWIDIIPLPAAPEASERAASQPPEEARLRDAPQDERDHDPLHATAPRLADGRSRLRPAPDDGDQTGRTSESAWRRDRSTLHAQLTDGADRSQPSRRRTSDRSSSPQAERREVVTGTGDAVRTEQSARVPTEPLIAERESSPAGNSPSGLTAGEDQPRVVEPVVTRVESPHLAERATAGRGVGPLDSQTGPRSFDRPERGPAADEQDQRAAADELRPGITDFSRAGVRAAVESPRGQGPGAAPGAVARPVVGAAPSQYGSPRPQARGPEVDERTQDRRYQRYIDEIVRRVNSVREFPKGLALRLEQGETVVRFVLGTDGRISDGVRVQKSSGFDEFDAAAARAVQRAAPFPPMPDAARARPLAVSVRVAFENPVVR